MADTTTLSDTDLALRLARALGWETTPPERDVQRFRLPGRSTWHRPWWLYGGDGMLRVLDAMRERGWKYNTADEYDKHSANVWRFTDSTELLIHSAWHNSLPRAVAEAALAALEAGQ